MTVEYGEYEGAKTVALTNKAGMTVRLCALGAGIMSVTVPDKNGIAREVTSLSDANYAAGYDGKTIGRTAGRLANAEFRLDGRRAQLEKNSFDRDCLHGGSAGLHKRIFSLEVESCEGHTDAIFFYQSEDGEGGYFGGVNIYVTYRVYDGVNSFMIFFRGEPDCKLLLNLTNSTRFNVSGDGQPVTDQYLFVNASRVGVANSRLLIYKIAEVKPELDFRRAHKIGEHINSKNIGKKPNGCDRTFFLDSRRPDKTACALYSEKSGIKLEVSTSYPCVSVCTDNENNSVAIECEYHPDGIHKDINDCGICTPRSPYNALTVYTFTAGEGIKPERPSAEKPETARLG